MAQERMQGKPSAWEQAQVNETEALGAVKGSRDAGVDDLLDEIDGLLETNAEQFVKGYVQKGGQ
ncbi:ubiquitin-like protein Pup [Galactobacter valiniphilus]|mgnify:CR=1 FL=1|uniref:Prokaryotic ubiquitin-like protein Pup n=1 Tax=Galactobacter valiniphilus TaxID=2676122 RepID=A0A399J999_9MICC|nr:ubiquitin-like protein Pup [Galactobacter valiniphilus]RII42171.1 ubiquitin-like protein Pup [Galactobacter valiniphilus]